MTYTVLPSTIPRRIRLFLRRLAALLLGLSAFAFGIAGQNVNSPKKISTAQVESIYRRGMTALKSGDLATARPQFQEVVRLAPPNPQGPHPPRMGIPIPRPLQPAISQFRVALQLKPD